MNKIKVKECHILVTDVLSLSEVAKAKLLHKIVLLVKTLFSSKIYKPMAVKSISPAYNGKLMIYPQKNPFPGSLSKIKWSVDRLCFKLT